MNLFNKKYFHKEFLEIVKLRLFFLASIFITLGELLDLFLVDFSNITLYINSAIAAIMLLNISFYMLKVYKLSIANIIVIYSILLDIIISSYNRMDEINFEAYFLKMSLIVFAIIPMAGFAVGKFHCVLVGLIYYLNFIIIVLITKDEFLINSIVVITLAIIGFVAGMYILVDILLSTLEWQKQHIEKEQKINLKLHEVIEHKDQMYSIISHDLKNPFNAILGFTDLIQIDLKEKKYKNIDKHFSFLKYSTEKVYILLQNLLDWAGDDRMLKGFNPQLINSYDIVNNEIELLNFTIQRKQIIINNHLKNPVEIFGDQNMFSSVVRNILSNAIKFSYDRGVIEINSTFNKGFIEFKIKDYGIGLSQEKLDKLFTQGHVIPAPGTNQEIGSGIGLKVCNSFIRKHGGKIWATSNKKGITFYFSIPKKTQ